MSVIMPNFIKIGQMAAKIWRFNGSQNGGLPPSWICAIRFFNGQSGWETHFALATKFRKDRSNRCGYIAILVIFNMEAAAILNFQKFKILTTFPLYGANTRHHAKFHQNRSKGCRDMAI